MNQSSSDTAEKKQRNVLGGSADVAAPTPRVSMLAHEKCSSPYRQDGTTFRCGCLPASPEDLQRLVDWLVHCRVTTVALEPTGVYWIPLYELSEQRGIHPCLVNARHMKNVPGRRTDWHECQWLQFLSCGIHPSKPPTRSSAAADEIIRKSLVGNWRSEHLFTLRQSLEFYRFYQQQIVAVIWKSRRCR